MKNSNKIIAKVVAVSLMVLISTGLFACQQPKVIERPNIVVDQDANLDNGDKINSKDEKLIGTWFKFNPEEYTLMGGTTFKNRPKKSKPFYIAKIEDLDKWDKYTLGGIQDAPEEFKNYMNVSFPGKDGSIVCLIGGIDTLPPDGDPFFDTIKGKGDLKPNDRTIIEAALESWTVWFKIGDWYYGVRGNNSDNFREVVRAKNPSGKYETLMEITDTSLSMKDCLSAAFIADGAYNQWKGNRSIFDSFKFGDKK